MRAGTIAILLVQVSCRILEQDFFFFLGGVTATAPRWLIQSNTLRDVMKADISLGNSGASIVGLDRCIW